MELPQFAIWCYERLNWFDDDHKIDGTHAGHEDIVKSNAQMWYAQTLTGNLDKLVSLEDVDSMTKKVP